MNCSGNVTDRFHQESRKRNPIRIRFNHFSVLQFLSDQDNFFGSQSRFLENAQIPPKMAVSLFIRSLHRKKGNIRIEGRNPDIGSCRFFILFNLKG